MVTRWSFFAVALLAATSWAQGKSSDADRSYALFLEAEQAYRDGAASRAVELLLQAYRLKQEPVLLYNLARAYEALGMLEEAADSYERYVAAEPQADGRGSILTRVASLRTQLKERERLAAERLTLQRSLEQARAPRVPPLAWVVTGAGVVGLGVGAAFKVVALRLRDDAQAAPIHRDASDLFARATGFDTASTALFIAGAVLAVGGAVWAGATLLLGRGTSVAMAVGPGSVTLTWSWP